MIDPYSVLNNLIAAFIFALLSFFVIYIFRKRLNKSARNYFISTFKKAIGEKSYEDIELELAINNVAASLKKTRVFFLRIGNFNINKLEYNKVVSFAIDEELIWDYHIHLSSSLGRNSEFLKDFYFLENYQITKVKPVNTTHLIEISRGEFLISIGSILSEYKIDKSFVDIVIQGVLSDTEKYPRLNEINLAKLNVSSVMIFFPDKAKKILDSNMDEIAQRLIHKTKDFETESLYIGEECLDEHDEDAIEFGRKILAKNS